MDKQLYIGWAEIDITPSQLPVLVSGQFPARLSEEILDPLKATALVLQSPNDQVTFISIDVVSIPDEVRDIFRKKLATTNATIKADKVILNATHTHTGPEIRQKSLSAGHTYANGAGLDLGEYPVDKYIDFLTDQLVLAACTAWQNKQPGGIAYGIDEAVVGRNRRWVNSDGASTMYRLDPPQSEKISHIEGYEDHSLNILATYDLNKKLTGLVVNVPCPSQVSEHLFALSADYWYETKKSIRKEYGDNIFILPQCSSAGDIAPRRLFEKAAGERMCQIKKCTPRDEIAQQITNAVNNILPFITNEIEFAPELNHHVSTINIPLNNISEADACDAQKNADELMEQYNNLIEELNNNPEIKSEKRWYVPITAAFKRAAWFQGVVARYELQKTHSTTAVELHTIRIGDIAFASFPQEYYLDFGIQIKVKSPFIQTFLVQLAGSGTYVPSFRSVAGGGYGSMPASNPVGPEGGQIMADHTVKVLSELKNKG